MLKLDSVNVVQIEEYYETQNYAFIIIELCKIDLYSYLKKYQVSLT